MRSIVIILLFALICVAQEADNLALDRIEKAATPEIRARLLDELTRKCSEGRLLTWAYDELFSMQAAAGQTAAAFGTAERGVDALPLDLELASEALKLADKLNDVKQTKLWAERVRQMGRKVAEVPKPHWAEDIAAWQKRVDFAQEAPAEAERALYSVLIRATEPSLQLELLGALDQLNPRSEYLPVLVDLRVRATQATQGDGTAMALAERLLPKAAHPEDLTYQLFSYYAEWGQQPAKANLFAQKLIDMLSPQVAQDGAIRKQRGYMLGSAYWYLGQGASQKEDWTQADRLLRQALLFSQNRESLQTAILYHLGYANLQLGSTQKDRKRIQEAMEFNNRCAAQAGPLQEQARKNYEVAKELLK